MQLIFRKAKSGKGKVFIAFPFEKWGEKCGREKACMTYSTEGHGVVSYDFLYNKTYPAKPTDDRKLLGHMMEWSDVEILADLPPMDEVIGLKGAC